MDYSDLTVILDLMEVAIKTKEKENKDTKKDKNLYFSLVNFWGENAGIKK